MNLYIGIDLGTSSVKLMLMNGEGRILNEETGEYPVCYPHPGWSEQDPGDWWEVICLAMPRLLCGFDGMAVRGIGVAGQMHGLVVLDREDRVIRPAILWNDGRTQKQTDALNQGLGRETLFARTGNIAFAGFTAPKILWMRENEPELFERIESIMLPKDYVNYLLTGEHCTDFSDASGMLLLDVKNRCWSADMLALCGIREEQLPRLCESCEVVGRLRPELAERFGIHPDAIVVAGAADNAAAAVGTGVVGNGGCNISLGTSGTVFVSSERFSGNSEQAIHAFCHADGGYHLMGCILSAASCNKWFCEQILHTGDFGAQEAAVDPERLGENEVFFLPYLMGERSPINDTNATGMFIGLRPNTTQAEMYLAVLEGVAFAIKDNLEVIRRLGVEVSSSCVCGGGARSALWRRVLANVLNIDLQLPQTEQGPGYGAAMLAMVGAGEYATVEACSRRFPRIKETILPEAATAARYAARYEQYRRIYPAVKKLYEEIKA